MNRRLFLVTTGSASFASTASAKDGEKGKYIEHVNAVVEAWRRKDIDAVLARVTDDIQWHSHVGSPPIAGKEAMRRTLTTLAGLMSDIRWRIFHHAQSENRIFLEGADDFVTGDGRRVEVPYMGVMAFRGDVIAEWRDYFDRGLFDKLKSGAESPDYIKALVARPPGA